MNETFLEALTTWQSKGRRMFEIKVDSTGFSKSPTLTITCYDSDNGVFFYPKSAEEVTTANMIEKRKCSLVENIARWQAELAKLEGDNAQS